MGTYGPQGFYLPDETDLVDVERDLNYNVARADTRLKALVQYQMTEDSNLLPYETGFKWWKKSTNSIWYATSNSNFRQTQADVPSWSSSGIGFVGGYKSYDETDNKVAYSVFNNRVTLRGRIILNNFDELPRNVSTTVLGLPSAIWPARSRFQHVQMGTGSTGPQSARIFISTAGGLLFVAYGPVAASSDQRFISLSGIEYEILDA